MPSHNQLENSASISADMPMSPKSRRLAEFTLKQFQNGVLERARSTLSSLGDVWKTKHENNHQNHHHTNGDKSSSINRATALDFLSIWSRHKKSTFNDKLNRSSKSFDNEHFDKCINFTDRNSKIDVNNDCNSDDADDVVNGITYSNSKCFHGTSAVKYLNGVNKEKSTLNKTNGNRNGKSHFNDSFNGDRHKNKISSTKKHMNEYRNLGQHMDLLFDKNHNIKQNSKSTKLKNKFISRFSRIKSFEIDDVRHDDDEIYEWNLKSSAKLNTYGRSFDETVDYLDHSEYATDRNDPYYHKASNVSTDDDDSWSSDRKSNKSESKIQNDNENIQSIVKAKLKFKKVTSTDDININKSTKFLKPAKLFRHSSVEPQYTYLSDEQDQNIIPIIVKKPKISLEDTDTTVKSDLPKKPRKKLSFREPIVCGRNYVNFRSDTLPRAKRFLEEYERRKLFVKENNELIDLDLEVHRN